MPNQACSDVAGFFREIRRHTFMLDVRVEPAAEDSTRFGPCMLRAWQHLFSRRASRVVLRYVRAGQTWCATLQPVPGGYRLTCRPEAPPRAGGA